MHREIPPAPASLDRGSPPGYVYLLTEIPVLPESQRAAFPRTFARMKNGTLILLILLLLFAFTGEPAFRGKTHENHPEFGDGTRIYQPIDPRDQPLSTAACPQSGGLVPLGRGKALDKARREDKPILLSIGYSACHWCHVMERESFENEAIAEVMNAHFVNVKVDREERPDLDTLYMNYVQMTTGSGGWPMTVFLTPDEIPFFGGNLFPSGRPLRTPRLRAPLPGAGRGLSRQAGRN